MKKISEKLCHYFESVPDQVRKNRLFFWGLLILVTIFLGIGTTKGKFDMTIESWFSDDDPAKVTLNQFRDDFGSDDGIYIVYKPKDGDVFSEASLKAIQGIRNELLNYKNRTNEERPSMLRHIIKVNTIVNANVLHAEQDMLISRQFIGKTIPTDQAAREALREEAKKRRDFRLLYYSNNFQYGGITIQTDFGTIPVESVNSDDSIQAEELELFDEEISMEVDEDVVVERTQYKKTEIAEYVALMKAINQVLNQPKYADHLTYYPVGNAPLMTIFMELLNETGPFYIGMLLIMIIFLWFLFRSFSAVLWPILTVILTTIWTLGVCGWMGVTFTNMISLTILLILAVGIADSIHIISGYLYFRSKRLDHQQALRAAFRKSALACLLTSVTTICGMLSLVFTPISHIQVFGYSAALGVFFAFLLTIYILPMMLDLWSPVEKRNNNMEKSRFNPAEILQKLLSQMLPIVQKSPLAITLLFGTIFVVCLYGTTQLKIDTNYAESTKEGHILREIFHTVDTYMMGSQNMELLVDTGEENGLQDPRILQAMESLQKNLEEEYSDLIVKTSSIADVVKEANQLLNEGQQGMYKIPNNSKMLVQTLFMFNNANPEDRRRLISDDYSRSHISVQLYNGGSYEYIKLFDKVEQDIDKHFGSLKKEYPNLQITVTGGLALVMKLTDYISWAQIESLGFAILIISGILIILFGSMKIGLLSILPNLLPATLTFGLLGLSGIPLDSDTLVIAPVIIGIAVDDTIHFISHFRSELLQGQTVHTALRFTINEVGQAVTFTSLTLGMGFFILSFSTYMSLIKIGFFGALAIFMALLCDLLLLPALILLFEKWFAPAKKEQTVKIA